MFIGWPGLWEYTRALRLRLAPLRTRDAPSASSAARSGVVASTILGFGSIVLVCKSMMRNSVMSTGSRMAIFEMHCFVHLGSPLAQPPRVWVGSSEQEHPIIRVHMNDGQRMPTQ